MKRLKNSMKALIVAICVVVVFAGVILGVVLHNKNKSYNQPFGFTQAQKVLMNAINNKPGEDLFEAPKSFDNRILTQIGYSVNDVEEFSDKYVIVRKDVSGESYNVDVYLYQETIDGQIETVLLNDCLSAGQEYFNLRVVDAKNDVVAYLYQKEATAGQNYVLEFAKIDNEFNVVTMNSFDLVQKSEEEYIFQENKLVDRFYLNENFYVLILKDAVSGLYDFWIYNLSDGVATESDVLKIEDVKSSENFNVEDDGIFTLIDEDTCYFCLIDGETSHLVTIEKNQNVECNFDYFNGKLFVEFATPVANTQNIKNTSVLDETLNRYFDYSYKIVDVDTNTIQNFNLRDGVAKLSFVDVGLSDYFAGYEQKVENNLIVDGGKFAYFNLNSLERVIDYDVKNRFSQILRADEDSFLIDAKKIRVKNGVANSEVFDLSYYNEHSYSLNSLNIVSENFFVYSTIDNYQIFNINGVKANDKTFADISDFGNGRYIVQDLEGKIYLLNMKTLELAEVENFVDDEKNKILAFYGLGYFLVGGTDKFELIDFLGNKVEENIVSYEIANNGNKLTLTFDDGITKTYFKGNLAAQNLFISNYAQNENFDSDNIIIEPYKDGGDGNSKGESGVWSAVIKNYDTGKDKDGFYNPSSHIDIVLNAGYVLTKYSFTCVGDGDHDYNFYKHTLNSDSDTGIGIDSDWSNNYNVSTSVSKLNGGYTYSADCQFKHHTSGWWFWSKYTWGPIGEFDKHGDNYLNYTYATYTITLNKQSGSGGSDSFEVTFSQTDLSSITITVPTRIGYTFQGYYASTGGGGDKIVNSSGKIEIGNKYYTSSTTIYANWNPNKYSLSFSYDGGSCDNTQPTEATFGTSFAVYQPTKKGYTFNGWTVTNMTTGHEKKYGAASVSLTLGSDTTSYTFSSAHNYFMNLRSSSGKVYFKATWKTNSYRVNFELALKSGNSNITGFIFNNVESYDYLSSGSSGRSTISTSASNFGIKVNGSTVNKDGNTYIYKNSSYTFSYKPNLKIRSDLMQGNYNWKTLTGSSAKSNINLSNCSYQFDRWLLLYRNSSNSEIVIDLQKRAGDINFDEWIDKLDTDVVTFVACYVERTHNIYLENEQVGGAALTSATLNDDMLTTAEQANYSWLFTKSNNPLLDTDSHLTYSGARKIDVKSLSDFSVRVAITNNEYYKMQKIMIYNYGYYRNNIFSKCNIEITGVTGNGKPVCRFLNNSGGELTYLSFSSVTVGGAPYYYIGNPYNGGYNALRIGSFTADGEVSIYFYHVYFAGIKSGNFYGASGSSFEYNQTTVSTTGLDGFTIKAFAEAKTADDNSLGILNASENNGYGKYVSLNVQPITTYENAPNAKNGAKDNAVLWFNGEKYLFVGSDSASGANLSLNTFTNDSKGYYYINRTNKYIFKTTRYTFFNATATNIFNIIYVDKVKNDWVAYYYDASGITTSNSDNVETVARPTNSDNIFNQNFNNSNLIAVRPEQKKFNYATNSTSLSLNNFDRKGYFDLSSYLSGISISGITFTLDIEREIKGDYLNYYKISVSQSNNNELSETTIASNRTINYAGSSYVPIQQFTLIVNGKKYELYFAYKLTGSIGTKRIPKPFDADGFETDFELMYFIYSSDNTANAINLTFSRFNKKIEVSVKNNNDVFNVSDVTTEIVYEIDQNNNFQNLEISADASGNGKKSIENIQPSNLTLMRISPKDGYLIKKLVVRYGGLLLINVEMGSLNLGNPNVDDPKQYSFAYSDLYNINYSGTLKTLRAYTGTTNSDGLYGIYYSDRQQGNLTQDAKTSFGFESLFLVFGGLCENVSIQVETVSYIEFTFNDENNSLNFNVADTDIRTDSGVTYYNSVSAIQNLSMLIYDVDSKQFIKLGVDKLINTDSEDFAGTDYKSKHKYDASFVLASGSDTSRRIRVVFLGKAYLFNSGVKILASGENYSTYFDNGVTYNNSAQDGTNYALYSICDVAGRKANDSNGLSYSLIKSQLVFTDKLTFVDLSLFNLTGKSTSNGVYVFRNSNQTPRSNNFDFARKYILVLNSHKNTVQLTTNSFIYNSNFDQHDGEDKINNHSQKVTNGNGAVSVYYENIANANDVNVSWRYNGNSYSAYQLDYVAGGYKKANSWFNETVLTNINISYQYYNNNNLTYTGEDNSLNWQSINKLPGSGVDTNFDKSSMYGYRLNYVYYEIPGYYLQYIDIVTVDYGILSIPVTDIKSSNDNTFVEISGKLYGKIYYKVVYDADNAKFDIELYVKSGTDNGVDNINSLELISNNFAVNFYSAAYTMNLAFDANVDGVDTSKISTKGDIKGDLTQIESVTYDSMISINRSLSMPGYTFIGWGSKEYFDGTGINDRFDNTLISWNSTSSWLDCTSYFSFANRSILTAMKGRDLNSYDFYISYDGEFDSEGNFVSKFDFMTDTGSKSTENYNFWSTYAWYFTQTMGAYKNRQDALMGDNAIQLYAIWKANTYILSFDFNDFSSDNGSTSAFASNKLESNGSYQNFNCEQSLFNSECFGITEKNNGVAGHTYYFYVTFDTDNWFVVDSEEARSSLQSAFLAYQNGDKKFIDENNKLNFVIDRYGYTWLGWFNSIKDNCYEAYDIGSVRGINENGKLFGSIYYNQKMGINELSKPKFTKEYYGGIATKNEVVSEFSYRGQPKKLASGKSYVYFYDYKKGSKTIDLSEIGAEREINMNFSDDYLNKIDAGSYGFSNDANAYMAFFDTSLDTDCYSVSNKALVVNRNILNSNRMIKLYAYWEVNRYQYIYDYRDKNSELLSLDHIGSTNITNFTSQEGLFTYFDDNVLYNQAGEIQNVVHEAPVRVGYDFVGYTFFFYDSTTTNTETVYNENDLINQGNNAYLNFESYDTKYFINNNLLTAYNNPVLKQTLIPMFTTADGLSLLRGNSSSFAENQEALGGGKDAGAVATKHYVYLFAIWKPQTFVANLSLNIDQGELLNGYAEDNSYVLGFYNSIYSTIPTTRTYSKYSNIVNPNYLKYNASDVNKNYSDIVSNIEFVFKFDGLVQDAYCMIAGNKFMLKDLFAVSAGYYFLGWLLNSEDPNSILVANTLKTTFNNFGDLDYADDVEDSYSDIGTNVGGTWNADDILFDYTFYQKLFRSDYREDYTGHFEFDNKNNIQVIDAADRNRFSSTNFGYVTVGGKKMYLQVEETATTNGTNFSMFYLDGEVKFYVLLYYVSQGGVVAGNITFDNEFMYVNNLGVNYRVQFDKNGNAYFVTADWKNKVELNIRLAVYKEQICYSGDALNLNASLVRYSAEGFGSIYESLTSSEHKSFTFVQGSTRMFTLYAGWQIKEDLSISVVNGNNAAANSGELNSAYNDGLSGFYDINNGVVSTETEYGNNDSSYESIAMAYDFFDDLNLNVIPYYNGRFLSEMVFSFYGLEQYSEAGFGTKYRTTKYVITLNFKWDNQKKNVAFESISLVKVISGRTNPVEGVTTTTRDGSNGTIFNIVGISELSLIDANGCLDKTNPSFELFKILSYAEHKGNDRNLIYGRRDVNKLEMGLKDVMSSIEISCKFSIQTFEVDFYNFLDDDGDHLSLIGGTSNKYETGYSKDVFNNILRTTAANYAEYVSSRSYGRQNLATIRQNVAQGESSNTYNVPYGYFIYGNGYTSALVGNRPVDDKEGLYVNQPYNGYDFIYAEGLYNYGSTNTKLEKNGTDSYYAQCSPILGENNSFPNKSIRLNLSFYNFSGWFTYSLDDENKVILTEYDKDCEATYINKNITLYAYYYAQNKPTSVQFYTWNDETKSYSIYTGNREEYTLNSDITNTPFTNLNGKIVAKSGQTEYVDDNNYAKIKIKVQYGVDSSRFSQDNYTSVDFRDVNDKNVLNALLKTYWYYIESYNVLYIDNNDGTVSYVRYSKVGDYFYYLNSSNTEVKVEITSADDVNYFYNHVGSSTTHPLGYDELYKYNNLGAKLYIKVIDKYYELNETSSLEFSTSWLNYSKPRFSANIQGEKYYLLPRVKDSASYYSSETLYNRDGNVAEFSYSIEALNLYYIIINGVYIPVVYQTSIDDGGSIFVNPYTMPGKIEVKSADVKKPYYLNYTDKTLYTSDTFVTKADIEHKVYCPVNDNFTINALNSGSTGADKWTLSGTTINALPSPNMGFWYNNEQYGFVGYINVNDDVLALLKESADEISGSAGGGIYQTFASYIDAMYAGKKSSTYIDNLKKAVSLKIAGYTLDDLLGSLLIADSYTYNGSNIDYITVNIPCSFNNIEFEDEHGVVQNIPLSVVVKQQFKLVTKQTTVEGNIYAVPIYNPFVMEFNDSAVSAKENSKVEVDTEKMDVWHFESFGDTTHVYNKENGDFLHFYVLDKGQYTELYNQSSDIADYLTHMIKNNNFRQVKTEEESSKISIDFTGYSDGDYFIFACYYKAGEAGDSSTDYIVRVSDNFVHVQKTASFIQLEVTDMKKVGI